MQSYTIQLASVDDVGAIRQLIRQSFDEAVAPEYSSEGREEFYKYIEAEAMKERLAMDHFIMKADDETQLVGIIEIRKNEHVSMLFVAPDCQRQGIGKKLLQAALDWMLQEKPTLTQVTVHASPNAVTAYEHMGFVKVTEEQTVNGIRFTTMEITFQNS